VVQVSEVYYVIIKDSGDDYTVNDDDFVPIIREDLPFVIIESVSDP